MRLALATGLAVVLAVLAAGASAKEGGRARLTRPLQLGAAPGTTIDVRWTVEVPDGQGGWEPFGAGEMFARLLGRTGTASAIGFASTRADGSNQTVVRVPAGGIGGVRVGLRGRACGPEGCRTGDVLFPLVNDPFRSPGGVRCDVGTLAATLHSFVRAYNAGDLRRLDRLFARERFVWYSSGAPGARVRDEAKDRDSLVVYFARRHRKGDRLRALELRFNGYDRGRDLGHFELRAERRANDFRGGGWFEVAGKGALDCAQPPVTIAVLSLAAA